METGFQEQPCSRLVLLYITYMSEALHTYVYENAYYLDVRGICIMLLIV